MNDSSPMEFGEKSDGESLDLGEDNVTSQVFYQNLEQIFFLFSLC
jgi:hypothetical protein